MESQCSQYRVLGEPAKLRKTSQSSVCEPCSSAGHDPADPTRRSEALEPSGKAKCPICPNFPFKLVEDEGEYVCSTCAAVFQTARTLLHAGADEADIVSTLTFARLAAEPGWWQRWQDYLREAYGTKSWDMTSWLFQREKPNVLPLEVLNGTVLMRRNPLFWMIRRYHGTMSLRQVRIFVVSRTNRPCFRFHIRLYQCQAGGALRAAGVALSGPRLIVTNHSSSVESTNTLYFRIRRGSDGAREVRFERVAIGKMLQKVGRRAARAGSGRVAKPAPHYRHEHTTRELQPPRGGYKHCFGKRCFRVFPVGVR